MQSDYEFLSGDCEMQINIEPEPAELPMRCFGHRYFYLNNIDNYNKTWENFRKNFDEKDKELAFKRFNEEYPYFGVMEMNLAMWYNCYIKKFYNQFSGMVDNVSGDFFWSSERVLKVLRARKVPEEEIPYFLKNHKEVEARYLARDKNLFKELRYYHENSDMYYIHEDFNK